METSDARVRYTRRALKEALLEILKEKPIAKVTIKELCERAHLNRGTFYLHYDTPNDLLKEIESDFISENLVYMDPYMKETHNLTNLTGLFTCIMENRELCQVLMGPHGAPQFLDRIQATVKGGVLADWQAEFPEYSAADLEFVYDFICPGAMRAILSWLADDRGLSTADFARRLDRLGHYCHLAIREFGP